MCHYNAHSVACAQQIYCRGAVAVVLVSALEPLYIARASHSLTLSISLLGSAPFMIAALKRMVDALYGAPILLLTLTALFWGGNAVAGRVAIGNISPMLLTLLRWALVLMVLWPMLGTQVREAWPQIKPRVFHIAAMATLGLTVFNALFYYAAHHTTAINLGIIQGAIPVFVMAGAFLVFGTRVSPLQSVGVLVTLLGVAVVATRGDLASILGLDLNRGDLAMLVACVLYAAYTVALRTRPPMNGVAFFTLLAAFAALTSIPFVVVEALRGDLVMPTSAIGWLTVAYVAIFPSCLAQIFFMRGVDLIGPGRAGVFVNLVPVFASALGAGLLGEPFALYHAVALGLVFGGIWLAQRAGR